MTIQEAFTNVDVVVSNARMLRAEHNSLTESMTMIVERLKLADELEKEVKVLNKALSKALKKPAKKKK